MKQEIQCSKGRIDQELKKHYNCQTDIAVFFNLLMRFIFDPMNSNTPKPSVVVPSSYNFKRKIHKTFKSKRVWTPDIIDSTITQYTKFWFFGHRKRKTNHQSPKSSSLIYVTKIWKNFLHRTNSEKSMPNWLHQSY